MMDGTSLNGDQHTVRPRKFSGAVLFQAESPFNFREKSVVCFAII